MIEVEITNYETSSK